MTEECKKWVLELADSALSIGTLCKPGYEINTIAILIKAMWEINDGWHNNLCTGYCIKLNDDLTAYCAVKTKNNKMIKAGFFFYKPFDFHSKQEALEAALQHIFDNKDK